MQYITTSNIDQLCPFNTQQSGRVCLFSLNIQIPLSMSVQGIALASFKTGNTTTPDESSFVVPSAPLPSTPQLLAQLYNAPVQYTALDPRTSFAIFSSLMVVKQDDLDAYGRWMGLTMGNLTFDNLPYEQFPSYPRGEATLDTEIMLGMIKGATSWHWNFDTDGFFFQLASALLNDLTGTPDVISISYGVDEDQNFPLQFQYVNNQFAMLATTSKTIITASGDNGVYGNGCACSNFTDPSQCGLCCSRALSKPEWPATSPYVVAVGGTSAAVAGSTPFYQNPSSQQNTNFHSYIHEIMAGAESGSGGITSGGGYSSMFPALPFQRKAIRGYLAQQSSNTSLPESIIAQSFPMWPATNASGTLMRGYPDVSALAVRIPYVDTESPYGPSNGRLMQAGTSASTPIFASYVVMMNDMRLQAGLPKLGNILPLLYMLGDKHPEVYNDVTVGYHGYSLPINNGCGGMCRNPFDCIIDNVRQGLTAAPGWDATTGFGSINFERMLRYVLPGVDFVSLLKTTQSAQNSTAAAQAAAASSAQSSSSSASSAMTSAANVGLAASAAVASRVAAETAQNSTAAVADVTSNYNVYRTIASKVALIGPDTFIAAHFDAAVLRPALQLVLLPLTAVLLA